MKGKGFVKFNEGAMPVEKYMKWLAGGVMYHYVKTNGYVYKVKADGCEKFSRNLKKRIGVVRGAELKAIQEYIGSDEAAKVPVMALDTVETADRKGLMVKKDDKKEIAC